MDTARPPGAEPQGLKLLLRALRHRNYRLFFTGQSLSLVGTWMTRVATGWLVYRLTDSPALLGVVGFAGQVPIFLLAPLAGVLADRWDRRRLLILTQVLSMAQSLTLAALTLTGVVTVWHVIALSLFQGVVNAFDTPLRLAFVVDMVDRREDVPNAIALNSSMFNGARLVGPSLAGIIIAVWGEGICFLLDGISYAAVIASLAAMRLAAAARVKTREPVLRGLREGLRVAFGIGPIRAILLMAAFTSLVGAPYLVLMPVVARDVLGGDSHTLGFLMGAVGLGALGGAFFLASRRTVRGLSRILTLAAVLFGLGLAAFSQSRLPGLSYALMLVVGFGMMVQLASSNTILQTVVDDDKRGRVMSLYTTSVLGIVPFGSLLAGSLADRFGAPATLLAGGLGLLAAAAVFARYLPRLRALMRPIYVRKGIIPEVATGIQSATHISTTAKD
ncbi:MAG: MFS transporter [Candidatus Zixiibacteriota bacterium]|nr:MAG: MFS transporter [candidate division Zixibacteria bacterium]